MAEIVVLVSLKG